MDLDDAIRLASDLYGHVEDLLLTSNSPDQTFLYDPGSFLSEERLFQVAQFSLRDLGRLERDQNGRVSVAKCVGYVAFWFSKLKPINSVSLSDADNEVREISEINETVALSIAERLLWSAIYGDPEVAPSIWAECPIKGCAIRIGDKDYRGKCFHKKNFDFFSHSDGKYKKYMIHCMRFRSMSPYFLVNYVEQSLFYSCEHSSKKLYS